MPEVLQVVVLVYTRLFVYFPFYRWLNPVVLNYGSNYPPLNMRPSPRRTRERESSLCSMCLIFVRASSGLTPMKVVRCTLVTAPEAQTAEANLNACTAIWAYYPSTAHLNIDSPVRVQGLDTAQTSRRDKWQIRPALSAACENWRDRENIRFARNGYKEVPWADHPAWKELLKNEPHASHFLHISTQDEVYISFTPNDEYGKFDRQLKITPMRYFKKHCPDVSSTYINEWIKKWVVTNNHHTILYARTSDEIRRVYENGPPSCMSHKRSRFWGDGTSLPHPSEAYAGGDLAVAYITRNIGGWPVVTSRVVVWPDKKVMGPKVYGTDAHLLRMLLEDEGYESKKGGFHGARLLKIYYPKEHVYIMPYIDGAKILLTTEGEIVFNSDDGVDASATNRDHDFASPFRDRIKLVVCISPQGK